MDPERACDAHQLVVGRHPGFSGFDVGDDSFVDARPIRQLAHQPVAILTNAAKILGKHRRSIRPTILTCQSKKRTERKFFSTVEAIFLTR